MWSKWLPWRYIIRQTAKTHGFLDPLTIFSRLQNFAKPSEVMLPLELLRSAIVLHARGLINSQAIQHNLDWIWPYWVEQQFDPVSNSFIPRAFSLTHINLTHRNWTAIGIPSCTELPIVDERGLLTPYFDGWSIDAWLIQKNGNNIFPSRSKKTDQYLSYHKDLSVVTKTRRNSSVLITRSQVIEENSNILCRMLTEVVASDHGWIVISIRPYNPEGISFIQEFIVNPNDHQIIINKKQRVFLNKMPQKYLLSNYQLGDVFHDLYRENHESRISCEVGMATAALFYPVEKSKYQKVIIDIPLLVDKNKKRFSSVGWVNTLKNNFSFVHPNKKFQFLFETSLRTLLLHTSHDFYAGPFTYKRFWIRDATFAIYALLCLDYRSIVFRLLKIFMEKQTRDGYFKSQNGEWDSNGQVLWILHKYFQYTNESMTKDWKKHLYIGAQWIKRKRIDETIPKPHAGLLPAGFSAEHLGPNDYYYWDDFWSISGLLAASSLLWCNGEKKHAKNSLKAAKSFYRAVDNSIYYISERLKLKSIPASPYRRMDSGAIGSIVAGYPLQLWAKDDPRLLATVEYLLTNCFVNGAFFHDMIHSGINPYLTLHIAEVLMRAGDDRFFPIVDAISEMASSTGQWPEAIHPYTKGGCMGDGQHVWAAAEWILMMKNMFVFEERKPNRLVIGCGIRDYSQYYEFGPVLTAYGEIKIFFENIGREKFIRWEGKWHNKMPLIEVRLKDKPSLWIRDSNRIKIED